MEKCPGVISIHDDIVIYGTSDQDHDANLINLLNVAQLEGLVLNSKKLELQRPKVSFFGAEYSVDGMHPCPKKIQGITEDDTSHWQTATGKLHRNGHLHGELRATSITSHWATAGNAKARRCVSLGWGNKMQVSRKLRTSLPNQQASHSGTITETRTSHSTSRCLPKGAGRLFSTGGESQSPLQVKV